jgi:hypothetical protein
MVHCIDDAVWRGPGKRETKFSLLTARDPAPGTAAGNCRRHGPVL